MAKLILVALDAGHGGVDTRGKYTTAPSKQFFHQGLQLHNGGWFYEGVSNRRITDRVAEMLDNEKIGYIKVYSPVLDTPLQTRVAKANKAKAALLISNHSNASPDPKKPAAGFEVFTTRGQTRSDMLATYIFEEMQKQFGNEIRYRTDYTDRDPDKEANFTVIARAQMPAVLVENLFFDNPREAVMLCTDAVVDKIATAQVAAIKRFLAAAGWAV